ncbi:hypothetical protein [Streptomyces sp. NPDC053541]|uniref:hypothetical protein n=1 Tax=Streptomyces sp. NPDC053541 TaxID=3365709 RepID=UPI0037D3E7E8
MSLVLATDPRLLDDLAALTRTGIRPETAVRMAVAFMATAYRNAWADGLYPPTATPRISAYQLAPYSPAPDTHSE